MMFTKREQIDVPDDHHLIVVFIKNGIVQDSCGDEKPVIYSFLLEQIMIKI